jgi:Ca-activated chloride channel family protein
VKKNYDPGFINRVLLISDGQANAGLINSNIITGKVQQYKAEGITLSSFGVGLDYNEVLMTDMAEAGSGNYYFINAPDKMTVLFDNELHGLLNVAAQDAVLSVVLPGGVKIEKVFGYKHEQTGASVAIKFRDLFSNEKKGVLIQFNVADGVIAPLKFKTSLSYNDVADGHTKTLTNENILSPNSKAENYLAHYNKKVVEQVILYIASDRLDDAMLEADKANFGKARSLVKTNKTFIDSNRVYVTSSVELQRMDSTNLSYLKDLNGAETKSAVTIKYLQKSNRAGNYKIRNKKE